MPPHSTRPENRSRGTSRGADWADTVPVCFRSEGFAEDLHDSEVADSTGQSAPAERGQWVARTAQSLRVVVPAWGLHLTGLRGPVGR